MSSRPRHDAKYATIAADLKARIRSGEYPQGTALPPQRALSSAYGVTLMTLRGKNSPPILLKPSTSAIYDLPVPPA